MNSQHNKTLEINKYNNNNVNEETNGQTSSDSGKSVDNSSYGSSKLDDSSDTQEEDRIIFSTEFKTYCQLQFNKLTPKNAHKYHYNWALMQGKQPAARVAWNAFKKSKEINLKRQLVGDVDSDQPNRKRALFAKEEEENVVSLGDNVYRREMEEMRKMMMEPQERAEEAENRTEEAENRAEQERQDKVVEKIKRREMEKMRKMMMEAQKQAEEAEKRAEQARQERIAEKQMRLEAEETLAQLRQRRIAAQKQAEEARQDRIAAQKRAAEVIARNGAIIPIDIKRYFAKGVEFPPLRIEKDTSTIATNKAKCPLIPSTIYKMKSDDFIHVMESIIGSKLDFKVVEDIGQLLVSQFRPKVGTAYQLSGTFILLLNALTNTLTPFRNDQGTQQLYGWMNSGNTTYLGDMMFCKCDDEDPLLIAENEVLANSDPITLDPTSNFCAFNGETNKNCKNDSCYCCTQTGNPIQQLHTYMTSGTKTSYFGMYSTYKTNMPVIYLANDAVLYVDSPPAEETPYMYVLLMLVLKENLGDKLRNVLNEKFNFPINSYENDNDNIKEVRKEASQRQNGGKDKQNDMETQNENSSNSMNIYENFTRLSLGTENTEIVPSLENITQRYTIEHIKFEVIGYGRSGEVLRTAVFGKDCALKTADSFKDFEGDAMLENELEIYKHLKRNKLCGTVVPIIIGGGYTREGFRGIATEYIPSETLDTREEEASFKASAREGLKQLHDIGVLHNDIKIENILCKQKKAVFIDFGIAKILDREKYEKDFVNEVKALELLLDTI